MAESFPSMGACWDMVMMAVLVAFAKNHCVPAKPPQETSPSLSIYIYVEKCAEYALKHQSSNHLLHISRCIVVSSYRSIGARLGLGSNGHAEPVGCGMEQNATGWNDRR